MKRNKSKIIRKELETQKYCPTQHGNITAFMPEHYWGGLWLNIPMKEYPLPSIPYPKACGGVLETIGLFGYEQAQALAWSYAAFVQAQGHGKASVRIQAYEVTYDIKARKNKL